jgi:hypothetical protein
MVGETHLEDELDMVLALQATAATRRMSLSADIAALRPTGPTEQTRSCRPSDGRQAYHAITHRTLVTRSPVAFSVFRAERRA